MKFELKRISGISPKHLSGEINEDAELTITRKFEQSVSGSAPMKVAGTPLRWQMTSCQQEGLTMSFTLMPECPHCGSRHTHISARDQYSCDDCGHRWDLWLGTLDNELQSVLPN